MTLSETIAFWVFIVMMAGFFVWVAWLVLKK
jgi:hypothetical protein